jgi:imidazolonepropionase-like amidohydrolase
MKTLFSGGLVFDGENAPVEGHAVLIEGGKVLGFAPEDEFTGFEGARIDTAGGMLLPGLIDCHVHLISDGDADVGGALEKAPAGKLVMNIVCNALSTLRGGITAVRDCGGKDFLELSVRDAVKAGKILGPTILTAGQGICMTGGHGNPMARIADGPSEVVKAVREQIHAGSDLIKLMATGGVLTPGVNPEDAHYSAEELAAGIAEGHRFGRRSASHAQGAAGIMNAVNGGIDSIEHGIWLSEECVTEMVKRGTYLVPTLAPACNILAHKDKGIPPFVIEKCEQVAEIHRASIAAFYKAGGKIAMGTDAGTPFNRHGENTLELLYMTEVGITPLDALRFSTTAGADLMGLKTAGRIAEGMDADLLIVDGNPVEDIRAVAESVNHRAVYKRGVKVITDGDVPQVAEGVPG